jgi:D-3-phosphoglycerate dehydrogenase
MIRILHLEANRYPQEAMALLKPFEVECYDCYSQSDLEVKLESNHYDVIITKLGLYLSEKCLSSQPTLKYIISATTGLNHIDVVAANTRNIEIISLKGEFEFLSSIKSTAEHTWGLLLSLIRNIPSAIHSVVNQNKWDRNPFMSDELDGKNLGIIGYGRLGKIVSSYALAFGMNVLVHDTNSDAISNLPNGVNNVSIDLLLSESDFVLLLISWSLEAENYMDKAKFSLMKPSAYFVNTSRGELVNQDDLIEVLLNKRIKGAALDVLHNDSSWSDEAPVHHSIIEYARINKNLLITPHMGGYGKDSIERTRLFVLKKFISRLNRKEK